MFDCFLQGVLMEFVTVVLRSTLNKNLRIKIWKWRKLWGTQINMRSVLLKESGQKG